MNLTRQILNSKIIYRIKRNLALKSGIYCKLKVLAPTVSEEMRTAKLLNHYGITTVIDVGANTGQFAESLIDFGYKGKIVSFEPVESAYNSIAKRAKKYPQWTLAERGAIGNMDGTVDINVSDDTQFSSIKKIKDEFIDKQGAAKIVKTERVAINKLDSLMGKYFDKNEVIFLKIDTQGFEKEVIEGATELIKIVKGMKMEIPLVNDMEIYENVEWDIVFYINFMTREGFKCMSIDAIGADRKTGIVNEVDGIFFRP
jgi:FkbM family methyltransferase